MPASRPTIAVVTAQREAILPLVLAGAGATLFPRPLAEQAARSGAAVVALRPRLTRPVHLFHRRGPLSPAATAFVALAPRPPETGRRALVGKADPEARLFAPTLPHHRRPS